MKILGKIIKNNEELDSVEKIWVIFLMMFMIICIFIHIVLAVTFKTMGINNFAIMSLISVVLYLINIYFLSDIKRINIATYGVVVSVCFYIIYSTYILGYDKGSIMLLPILLLMVHTVFPKKAKVGIISSITIFLGLCITMYIRYSVEAEFERELAYMELVNLVFAFGSILLLIYTRKITQKIIKNYTEELEKISNEANRDFLTGLYNRRFIEKRFIEESHEESYLVMADIDFFKKVNDTYGHNCGDEVLQGIARILTTSFRQNDVVCRWGGEEFLIYVRDAEFIDLNKKLNNIRENIEKLVFKYEDCEFNITMSFGYSKVDMKLEVNQIIANADYALYNAKQTGRNKVVNFENIN